MHKEKSHPLKKGTVVMVRNANMDGKEIIEGEAAIFSSSDIGWNWYWVKFKNERKKYRRFVLPKHVKK